MTCPRHETDERWRRRGRDSRIITGRQVEERPARPRISTMAAEQNRIRLFHRSRRRSATPPRHAATAHDESTIFLPKRH